MLLLILPLRSKKTSRAYEPTQRTVFQRVLQCLRSIDRSQHCARRLALLHNTTCFHDVDARRRTILVNDTLTFIDTAVITNVTLTARIRRVLLDELQHRRILLRCRIEDVRMHTTALSRVMLDEAR